MAQATPTARVCTGPSPQGVPSSREGLTPTLSRQSSLGEFKHNPKPRQGRAKNSQEGGRRRGKRAEGGKEALSHDPTTKTTARALAPRTAPAQYPPLVRPNHASTATPSGLTRTATMRGLVLDTGVAFVADAELRSRRSTTSTRGSLCLTRPRPSGAERCRRAFRGAGIRRRSYANDDSESAAVSSQASAVRDDDVLPGEQNNRFFQSPNT